MIEDLIFPMIYSCFLTMIVFLHKPLSLLTSIFRLAAITSGFAYMGHLVALSQLKDEVDPYDWAFLLVSEFIYFILILIVDHITEESKRG